MRRIYIVILEPVQYGDFGHYPEEAFSDSEAHNEAVQMIESHDEESKTLLPEALEELYVEES